MKYLDANSRNNKPWVATHPQGGINEFPDARSANAFILKNPEYKLVEPKIDHNYVTFKPETESIITHENGQRIPGAVEAAYQQVRDPHSKKVLEQKYPELLSLSDILNSQGAP